MSESSLVNGHAGRTERLQLYLAQIVVDAMLRWAPNIYLTRSLWTWLRWGRTPRTLSTHWHQPPTFV